MYQRFGFCQEFYLFEFTQLFLACAGDLCYEKRVSQAGNFSAKGLSFGNAGILFKKQEGSIKHNARGDVPGYEDTEDYS
jgi:hypothetical protein